MLPVLFCSEHPLTLCEKVEFSMTKQKGHLFKVGYQDINPEFNYGYIPKEYLCARKVKNLRCEESKERPFESTLFWTELPKFIPNPEIDFGEPLPDDPAKWTKQVVSERDAHYTYSIRAGVEEEKRRKEHQKQSERGLW